MSITSVKQVSHVALKARGVEQQVDFYTHMVGLGETERDGTDRVYLRCNTNHHALVLIPSTETGIDHFALDAGSSAELEAAANALARAGIAYETVSTVEAGQSKALRLRDPDGYAEVFYRRFSCFV